MAVRKQSAASNVLPLRKVLTSLLASIVFLSLAILSPADADEKEPVPSPERQKEIAKLLDSTYGLARLDGTLKKQGAVKKLAEASHDTNLTVDERFVVLTTLIALARETGDSANWLEAVNSLVESYDVDEKLSKTKLLVEYLASTKTGSLKPVVEEAIAISRSSAEENRYAEALALLSAAESATKRSTGNENLRKSVAAIRDVVTAREKDWKAFQAARAKLASNATDPTASLTVGRWYALQEADWNQAISFLVEASDVKWKAAARLEEATPTDPASQLAIADAWYEIGESESGAAKKSIMLHAGERYEEVQPKLTSALQKQLVAKRLDEIAPLKSPKVTTQPTAPVNDSPTATKSTEWVDLLEWSEFPDWKLRGAIDWNANVEGKPSREGITLKSDICNRFPLPAIIDGDYELEVEFTRHDGDQAVGVFFPVGNHNMHLEFGTDDGAAAGVGWIDGKWFSDFGNPTRRRPSPVSNDVRHRINVRVQNDGSQAAFDIDWDETKSFIKWAGRTNSLTNMEGSPWKLTMIRHPWLLSYRGRVTFHKARIRMLSGTLKRDFISPADRVDDRKNGVLRLVGEKAKASAGWAQVTVGQLPIEMGPGDVERIWPLITRDFKLCDDYYGAHAPSRLKCPIPPNSKCFTVVGFNDMSKTVTYRALIDGKLAFDSSECGIAVIKIAVPPKSSLLELVVEAGEDKHHDCSYWCYPRFYPVAPEKVTDRMVDSPLPQSNFTVTSNVVGASTLTRNKPLDGLTSAPLQFRSALPCDEFIYAHAPSTLTFEIPDGMTRFSAIGYKEIFHHHVKFEVWADGGRIYQSPVAGIVAIDVKLPPRAKVLELKVDDLGHRAGDQSFWCYPRLHRQ